MSKMKNNQSSTSSRAKNQTSELSASKRPSLSSSHQQTNAPRATSIQSTNTRTALASKSEPEKSLKDMKETSRKTRAECDVSASTSHTQFFKKNRHEEVYEKIPTDEFFGVSESFSGSSDTFYCVHGSQGKVYSKRGLLKRNLVKNLDPIPVDPNWTNKCKPTYGWDIARILAFLVQDPTVDQQKDRLHAHLADLVKISNSGYLIDHLNNICVIMDYLVETLPNNPNQKDVTMLLLQNMIKPIHLNCVADTVKLFDQFSNYIGFLGYLLTRLEDDSMFEQVSKALIWHLSAPDTARGHGAAKLHHTLIAAAPVLSEIVTRMLAISTSYRFPTYHIIALLLSCNSQENCMSLMRLNILESIFYRFNPYFPDRELPLYDVNPADPQDINVKLGDSSVHMTNTITILLVLLKSTKEYLDEHPKEALLLPCPDSYAQRCFMWAFRYECRAREHIHERKALVTIAHVLTHCFGARLKVFSEHFMPDILTLCVLTELPPRHDWTSGVNFRNTQDDVHFKKLLIYFSVCLIKAFPHNRSMVESRHYLLGLMYLLDPGLGHLSVPWAPSLFAELRIAALQALVATVPRLDPNTAEKYGLIRRIMWYIEWYSESPYELSMLYWCLRLLHVSTYERGSPTRETSFKKLFDTHGVVILVNLCYTLLKQKTPPVEKAQAILCICLRLLASSVEFSAKVTCCVYPEIRWPAAINRLAGTMMDVALYSLDKHFIVSDRWLIAMLNFIWEGIIWKDTYREKFIANDGIYKLLDLITMTRPHVQCIALALVCDATKAGDAVGQLVTWRCTSPSVPCSPHNPNVVKRGSTIATLLASIFRDECQKMGVALELSGVIKEMESPIMSSSVRDSLNKYKGGEMMKSPETATCLAASDLAGSRMSKAYALLSMLSEDLEYKVSLADEAYNLYKNIRLEPEDETVLVLCAHYLTLKLNEVWVEIKVKSPGLLQYDEDILEEFLHIGRGWAKEIKRQQEEVLNMDYEKQTEEENSLYEFLARVRLNISLDALQEVRCVARSADRSRLTHAQLQDAVRAHHRRAVVEKTLGAPVIRTYGPPLDDQNITGQNVKVYSICPNDKPKAQNVPSSI